MTATPFVLPRQVKTNVTGIPYAGARAFFYATGTQTPQTVYQDAALTVAHDFPVLAQDDGYWPVIWLDSNSIANYQVRILSATGVELDNIPNISRGLTRSDLTSILGGVFDRTDVEIAAGVTPTNLTYQAGVIERYGALANDSTDNQVAISNAILVCAQSGGPILTAASTDGVYRHSGTLDWSHSDLTVRGRMTLRHTGSGVANLIDGGAATSIYNTIIRDVYEIGNAATTYCWDLRAAHHGVFNLSAKNCTVAGFRTRWCVSSEFNLRCTSNDGNFTTQPPVGLVLDKRGAGETTAFCIFNNTLMEGITTGTGIVLTAAFGNSFIGGASEGNDTGITQAAGCILNSFYGMDFEQNLTRDIKHDGGSATSFYGCRFGSNATTQANVDFIAGDTLLVCGGYLRWILCTGTNAVISGCQVASGGSVGIKGGGTRKVFGVTQVDGANVFVAYQDDDLGTNGVFTPTIIGGSTAGTQTYAANGQKGYYTRVGHVVFFTIWLNLATNSGGAGSATIVGLPFSSRNQTNCNQSIAIVDFLGVTLGAAGRSLAMKITPGNATGTLLEADTGSVSNIIAITAIGGTAQISISGSYLID